MAAAEREVMNGLALAKKVEHAPENGRAREEVIRRFIRSFVPKAFGVDTGFIIDSSGRTSRQVDIVIYRTDLHPVWEVGGVNYFMVECVVAIIENKASIKSVSTLNQALENIKSVKCLDSGGQGQNVVLSGPGIPYEECTSPDEAPQARPWAAIIAQESLTQETLLNTLIKWGRNNDRSNWPDFYVDVDDFAMFYSEYDPNNLEHPVRLQTYSVLAQSITFTNTESNMCLRPLLDLARMLADRLRQSVLVDWSTEAYLPRSAAGETFNLADLLQVSPSVNDDFATGPD